MADTPQETFALEVTMKIRKSGPNGEYLGYGAEFEMSERVELGTMGFLELTKILSTFHDVAQEIRLSNAKK